MRKKRRRRVSLFLFRPHRSPPPTHTSRTRTHFHTRIRMHACTHARISTRTHIHMVERGGEGRSRRTLKTAVGWGGVGCPNSNILGAIKLVFEIKGYPIYSAIEFVVYKLVFLYDIRPPNNSTLPNSYKCTSLAPRCLNIFSTSCSTSFTAYLLHL